MAGISNTISLNDRMTPVLRSIIKALDSTLAAMASVDKVSQKAFQQAAKDVQAASRALGNFNSTLSQTKNSGKQSFIHVVDGAEQAESAMDNLMNRAKGLLATYLGFQGISKLVQGGDTFIGNVARLDLMNDGMRTTAELQQKIYEASQRSLANYNEMTAAVGKLGITAKHSFKNNDEILAFTELLNKQFTIAGASQSEKAGAMYQLTQAMASGRLQGDEFRSILENAPMLAATIARSMNMSYKQMKEASTKGLITSDVIKKALFGVAKETNEAFANIPMKFGDLWMQVVNKMTKGLEPVYIRLSKMWNNKQFQAFIDGITNGLVKLLGYTINVVDAMANAGSFIAKNWQLVAPVIFFLVGAMTALIAANLTYALVTGISALASAIYTAWLDMQTGGTFAACAAQYGLNAALLACPITWIILGIMAIIAIIYLVVAAINHFAGTSFSATGFIAGVFKTLGAIIWNIFLAVGEFIWGRIQFLWNRFAMFANFLTNLFTNPVSAIIHLFSDMGMLVLNVIGAIAQAIDTVFGSNLSESVNGWKTGLNTMTEEAVKKLAPEEDYKKHVATIDKTLQEQFGLDRMGYKDSYTSGYNWGKDTQQKIKDNFKVGDKRHAMDEKFFKDMQEDLAKNTGATADNTKKLADGVNLSDEDVELLKESARIHFVNKMTSLTPKVNATFGDVRESADVNIILKLIEKLVKDASESDLSG